MTSPRAGAGHSKRMNQLHYIRRNLYALKRQYGLPIDIYQINSSAVDLDTGRKTLTKSKYHVPKAIVLPAEVLRNAGPAAQGKFAYGALYDAGHRYVVLDVRDLPNGLVLTLNDFAIYQHKRHLFKTVQLFDHRQAWFIAMRAIEGQLPGEFKEVSAVSQLPLTQGADHE